MLLCLLIHAITNTLSTMSTLSHETKTRAVQNVPRLSQLVILIVHPRQTQHITTSAAATAVPTTSAAATAVPTTSAAATALRCARLRLSQQVAGLGANMPVNKTQGSRTLAKPQMFPKTSSGSFLSASSDRIRHLQSLRWLRQSRF